MADPLPFMAHSYTNPTSLDSLNIQNCKIVALGSYRVCTLFFFTAHGQSSN